MVKSIPALKGILDAPLVAEAGVLVPNRESLDLVRKHLREGDWTYARVYDGDYVEVIRITGIDGSVLTVDRSVDETVTRDFAMGARFEYCVPLAATTDIINEVLLEGVTLTGTGAIKVTKTGPYAWNVHADKISVISKDPEIEVVDLYPTIFISKK